MRSSGVPRGMRIDAFAADDTVLHSTWNRTIWANKPIWHSEKWLRGEIDTETLLWRPGDVRHGGGNWGA